MNFSPEIVVFDCKGDELVGVLTRPEHPRSKGVLVVVGGPQYRIGSHRQFLLMARHLAAMGYPVFRFDYRGMGDSDGAQRDFENVDADLAAAIETFRKACPGIEEIVIWGLCDAASASLFFTQKHEGVAGLILLNPWVRTEQGLARSYVTHYYSRRLFEKSFWTKLLAGDVQIGKSLSSFMQRLAQIIGPGTKTAHSNQPEKQASLPARMLEAFSGFPGPTLLILSGNDLTASEFMDQARDPAWKSALDRPQVNQLKIPGSDHTFSRREWRNQVSKACTSWLESW